MAEKKKVKVLHVLNNLDRGGAENYVLKLIRNLDDSRFENYLAYTRGGPLLGRAQELPIELFKMSDRVLNFRNIPSNLIAMYRLFAFVRRREIDVIHVHLFEAYFWVFFVAFLARISLVRTVVGTRKDVHPWSAPIERLFSRSTARLVALTQFSFEELRGFGIEADKIEVIPNGVECSVLDAVSRCGKNHLKRELGIGDEKVIGSVGRLHWHKNHEMFLKAGALVCADRRELKFVIDGDGPLRQPLETLICELEIADRVLLNGWSEDVHALMAIFDIFVLSSVTEGAPTVILEAMALGVPVIATAVGGVPDIIEHGQTGLLVQSEDTEELAAELLKLINCPEEAQKLADAGRERCRNGFDFVVISRRIEEIYEACYSSNNRR